MKIIVIKELFTYLPIELFQEKCKGNQKKKKKLEHTVEENSDDESSDNGIVIFHLEADPVRAGGNRVEDEDVEEVGIRLEDNHIEDANAADVVAELFGESESEDEFLGFDEEGAQEMGVEEEQKMLH